MIKWLWERCRYTWELKYIARENLAEAQFQRKRAEILQTELDKFKAVLPESKKLSPMTRFRQRGGKLFADIRRDWYQEQAKYVETDPVLQQVISNEPSAPEVEDVQK